MDNKFSRRKFLQTTSLAGIGLAVTPRLASSFTGMKTQVRLGFIGVGLRGCNHLHNVLSRQDIVVPAICDIDPERLTIAGDLIVKSGRPKPEVYTGSELAFEKMLQRSDIDGVIIATPWLWHTRMAVASMKAGKYAGVEVSAANSLEECWDLVNTYESTRVPVMILENVCYRRDVMAVLNMVRQGISVNWNTDIAVMSMISEMLNLNPAWNSERKGCMKHAGEPSIQ